MACTDLQVYILGSDADRLQDLQAHMLVCALCRRTWLARWQGLRNQVPERIVMLGFSMLGQAIRSHKSTQAALAATAYSNPQVIAHDICMYACICIGIGIGTGICICMFLCICTVYVHVHACRCRRICICICICI